MYRLPTKIKKKEKIDKERKRERTKWIMYLLPTKSKKRNEKCIDKERNTERTKRVT